MKTTLTKFNINTSTQAGLQEWLNLKEQLRTTPGRGHCHDVWSGGFGSYDKRKALPEGEITLDTGHLFGNQWNTEGGGDHNGWRVFDWTINQVDNKKIKTGHYLDITDEMIEARNVRYGCGYCGVQADNPEQEFCQHCIGSKYLDEDELYMLRLLPMAESLPERPPLTTEESAAMLPAFREAKKATRLADFKQRQDTATKKARQAVVDAETEEAATLWLIDRDIDPELFIYYSHTQRFCFGWCSPLGPEAKADLVDKLGSEFPYNYDIKQTEEARLS